VRRAGRQARITGKTVNTTTTTAAPNGKTVHKTGIIVNTTTTLTMGFTIIEETVLDMRP
jgi:hypothetical protein